MMTVQLIAAFVISHVRVAAFAAGGPAAVMAHQQWCETAAVDKQQDLPLLFQVLFNF